MIGLIDIILLLLCEITTIITRNTSRLRKDHIFDTLLKDFFSISSSNSKVQRINNKKLIPEATYIDLSFKILGILLRCMAPILTKCT